MIMNSLHDKAEFMCFIYIYVLQDVSKLLELIAQFKMLT
jgi:hypothetical protein